MAHPERKLMMTHFHAIGRLVAGFALGGVLLLATGCGGEGQNNSTSVSAPPPDLADLPMDLSLSESVPALEVPAPGADAEMPALSGPVRDPAVSDKLSFQDLIDGLNMLLEEHRREHGRIPRNIDDMVQWKIIQRELIPPVPAGKKYVIDQSTGVLSVQNQ